MQPIEELYQPFGPEVIREVKAELQRSNGELTPLLTRLSIPSLSALENQHEALQCFLHTYGIVTFLKIMQQDLSAAQIERIKLERLTTWRVLPESCDQFEAADPEPSEQNLHAGDTERIVKWVDSPHYRGAERRAQGGQRRQMDRRTRMHLVSRERRHGSERRTMDRRVHDLMRARLSQQF